MSNEDHKIKIKVAGPSGSGKTFIVAAIVDALESIGVDCKMEGVMEESADNLLEKIRRIQEGDIPDRVMENVVGIEEIQAARAGLTVNYNMDGDIIVHQTISSIRE